MSALPCPRCLREHIQGRLRREAVQELPDGVGVAPLARDGSGTCCFDCAAADGLVALSVNRTLPPGKLRARTGDSALTWEMARVAVGNDRQEQYRLPGVRMGLAYHGLIKLNGEGDLTRHQAWLDAVLPVDDEGPRVAL